MGAFKVWPLLLATIGALGIGVAPNFFVPPPEIRRQEAFNAPVPQPHSPEQPAVLPPADAQEGFVVLFTRPAGMNVTIDGQKTSLRTPVRQPYRLLAGKHVVSFANDAATKKLDLEILVKEGETTRVVKRVR